MTDRLRVSREELDSIPLLRGFSDAQIEAVIASFRPIATSDAGGDGLLFAEGDAADGFYILTSGEVILEQDGVVIHHLRPLAVIGELGALCDLPRHCNARVAEDTELWRLDVKRLEELFAEDKDLGLRFQKNLLDVVSDKLQRDQVRMRDMRANIIHTQKAMKRMRDFLLESYDTAVSSPLHDVIEDLIRRNRRVNYRVSPTQALAATLRLDDGTEADVVQISRNDITVQGSGGSKGERVSGVLMLSGPEIPVSGKIASVAEGRVEIQLDLLLDEYAASLEGYLTRIQLADFVV
ncbi:cyclic nucleotide-binding domain-containing protein [Haliangium ochraceum]|uniref:Putative transcriptional regulator, Crp/Fnr family n=1 Tax=Haliangium ochraceum (strain DSM 14365 / JCM 11303 / SMP-2) TaxID=502025 RepID=D0LJJ4_HALO1|nr:cyclic nucleotide-binding domain-containing protein [Haliangium ochraceum]ACY16568.1 putative transcriptional regulator, Crp/Fnr family [Haliangium ochraceum DSM 14365]